MYHIEMFNDKKTILMGYIAKELSTNKVYYSKGATKLANEIGIAPTTILRNATFSYSNKAYKGYVIAKVIEIEFKNRGNSIKSNV